MTEKGLLICGVILLSIILPAVPNSSEDSCEAITFDARLFFQRQNELLRQRRRAENLAAFEYQTNVTELNRQTMIAIAQRNAEVSKQLADIIHTSGYDRVHDRLIQRQIEVLGDIGFGVLNSDDYRRLQNAISSMQTNYATVRICPFNNDDGDDDNCNETLEPQIQERLANSRNPEELKYYWVQWYDRAGTPMRNFFAEYVRLSKKAALLNNYPSYADYWLHFYEDPQFERNLDNVYNTILPLYKQIHGYVRYRLRQQYGNEIVPATGNIPMHLLGNMWGQQWDEVIDLFTPFPDRPFINVTREMLRQNYTVTTLFELGDSFFQSLNMRPLPASFYNLSVLERPDDRPIICHASAWDMFQDSDVRIKMCTEVNNHYLYVVHHELGHIQYYLQYENQPTVFRAAPNPGFHEAVGDVIALSVSTPKHLQRIGLSPVGRLDRESRINELFKTALKKIVFLPFAYTMDKYRYAVFRGEIDEELWNCGFWQMRSQFTGVEPPVVRTERNFDPPAKYHISADVEYLRYFAADIFQFQILKALCIKAGEYIPGNPDFPLDNCDIFDNPAAGRALSEFLAPGASKHWKILLRELTGETEMNPAALIEYFQPLLDWLIEENRRLNVPLDWDDTNKVSNCCPPFST